MCGARFAPRAAAGAGGRGDGDAARRVGARLPRSDHLAATKRRLEVLRGCSEGPLPGHALVGMDPQLGLVTDLVPCEDAHAQERSLTDERLALVASKDLWAADRNFWTRSLRYGPVARDGDTELVGLTNVPDVDLPAVRGAQTYRERWTIETLFQTVEPTLQSELSTLGYPKAALFGFAVALCAYNIYAVVQAALAARWGQVTVREDALAYYVADEIRAVQGGMDIALDDEAWAPFHTLLPDELARQLVEMAGRVQLARFCKTKRGPKKPVPPRTRYPTTPHVSTARLLVRRAGGDWS